MVNERVCVVMPVFNVLPLAAEAISKLIVNTGAALRFLVVDNASDESAEPLRGLCEPNGIPIEIIRNETNLGVYAALNQGLERADSEFVIICCTDHIGHPGWFTPCMAAIQQAGVGWASPEWVEGPLHLREQWNVLKELRGTIGYGLRPEMGSSLGVLHWKRMKEEVGSFDSSFFFVFGDADMVERLNDAHIPCAVVQGAKSHHLGNQSRRGLGLEEDMALEVADAARFVAKWKDRPDVLARHSGVEAFADPAAQERIRAHRTQLWQAHDPGVL